MNNVDWKLSSKVLFKNDTIKFENRKLIYDLHRCFEIGFKFKEIKYQTMMTICSFKVYLKKSIYKLYLIVENQKFSSNLSEYNRKFRIIKVTKRSSRKSLKSNCTFYDNESGVNCKGRQNCLDVCVNKNFIKVHQKYNNEFSN